ncbi:uncharacterized protein N7459_003644 [Penicillium hispanicum]|uniref:uncharacterized protein n=1 Tax=Penicillium hispanicum TaxID=1080232 RepID=UPI0025400FC1|nr:uncharacterized protein N7459_003644 [Penicillium hispanicum]KAJ5587879.1 hypothetical protein N7459_003644 [Penicillium hispanicum]
MAAYGVPNLSNKLVALLFDALDSDAERSNIAIIMASENFSLRDLIKYGLITLGYAMNPQDYSLAESQPFHTWASLILSTVKKQVDLERLVLAGARTLAQLDGPKVWTGELSRIASTAAEGPLLSPPRIIESINCPHPIGFFAACLANCHLLGLEPHTIMKDDAISPFWQTQDADHQTGARDVEIQSTTLLPQQISFHGLTNSIRPTPEQLTIPHHPYLDVIPWPSFRARAVVASSMNPPLIDEGDLCLDLFNNGLYCWGSHGVSLHGRGEGTPWDSRSWEAKPWFLRKWSLLTSGSDVQHSSAWWRSKN